MSPLPPILMSTITTQQSASDGPQTRENGIPDDAADPRTEKRPCPLILSLDAALPITPMMSMSRPVTMVPFPTMTPTPRPRRRMRLRVPLLVRARRLHRIRRPSVGGRVRRLGHGPVRRKAHNWLLGRCTRRRRRRRIRLVWLIRLLLGGILPGGQQVLLRGVRVSARGRRSGLAVELRGVSLTWMVYWGRGLGVGAFFEGWRRRRRLEVEMGWLL